MDERKWGWLLAEHYRKNGADGDSKRAIHGEILSVNGKREYPKNNEFK